MAVSLCHRVAWVRPFRASWLIWLLATPADDGQPFARDHPSSQESAVLGPADQAFVALFARYQLPLLDFLYGMTRDRETAADLVQETFLKAYASGQDLAALDSPRAWLFRIATNAALNALRRRQRFRWIPLSRLGDLSHVEPELLAGSAEPPSLPPLPPVPQCDDIAVTIAEREAVWQVLAELPARWRAVLLMQTTGGFAVGEIATLLHLSQANVRKMLSRAKERFRQLQARLDAQDAADAREGRSAADSGKGAG